jgi:hypothetical protein
VYILSLSMPLETPQELTYFTLTSPLTLQMAAVSVTAHLELDKDDLATAIHGVNIPEDLAVEVVTIIAIDHRVEHRWCDVGRGFRERKVFKDRAEMAQASD